MNTIGLPAPAWAARVRAMQATLVFDEDDDLPDEGLVSATALDPELATASPIVAALRRHGNALPVAGYQGAGSPMLSDQAWVALQQICD